MKHTFHIHKLVLLVAFITLPFVGFAQGHHHGGGNSGNGIGNGGGGGGATAPLDGGLSLLVAAGIGFGAKKMAAKKGNEDANK